MAKKRMFSLSVVDTDNFLEMPISSRLLYYELGMRADDDGFVDNWKKILLFTGLKEDDLKILITKSFIIPFESGVIVIRHWRMNNYLQKDRITPTQYQKELKQLEVDNNNVYNLYTNCIHSIDKNSIDKNSIDKNSIDKKENIKRKKYGEFKRILLTDKEYQRLINEFGEDFIKEQIRLLDEYIESNNNKNKYTNFNLVLRKSIRDNWFNKSKEKDIPDWFDKDFNEGDFFTDEERRNIEQSKTT